jgi:hypothetical protein
MEGVNHRRLSYAGHHDGLCETLAAHVALIHCRQGVEENQIAIRFENGYGVTIVAVSQEEVFEVLVLKFYGAGLNDYQVAQYAPVPELNRGSWSEIIDLCQHIARLPISKARTGAPAQTLQ